MAKKTLTKFVDLAAERNLWALKTCNT